MSLSDAPFVFAGENAKPDLLGRGPAVEALRRMLGGAALSTPLVVGIYGGWGTGKTSVMQTLRVRLEETASDPLAIWFDAWIYARQETALWRALLLRIVAALRERTEMPDDKTLTSSAYDVAFARYKKLWVNDQDAEAARAALDEARDRLYRSMTLTTKGGLKVDWWGALPLAADAALTAVTAGLNAQVAQAIVGKDAQGGLTTALAKWFKGEDTRKAVKLIEREASERYVEQVTSLEQFQELFRELLARFGIGEKGRRLFVFVDDLDRCLPEDAVAALEAIKLFLDLPGCIFVLGMDRLMVEQGIRVRYKGLKDLGFDFDAVAYLDKVIQVPLNLPMLGETQVRAYLAGISEAAAAGAFGACSDLILEVAPPNPRTLKRLLNSLLLTLYLDGFDDAALADTKPSMARKDRVRRLCKLLLLQVCFDPAWRAVAAGGRETLKAAEQIGKGREAKGLDAEVKRLFEGRAMERLFRLGPDLGILPDRDLDALLTLTKATQSPEPHPGTPESSVAPIMPETS
jgi:hypothetical protein